MRRKTWVVAMLIAGACGGALAPPASADRVFTPRFATNDTGDVAIAAAPLMTCPVAAAECAVRREQGAAQGPVGSANIAAQNNNNYTMEFVNTDGDPATSVNASTASLLLPAGATVLFAGLYWGSDDSPGVNGAGPFGPASRGTAKFKLPGEAYQTLTATTVDVGTGQNANRFQSFVDVTALVAAAGAGTYAVGDVRGATGQDQFAGWSLVVAYRDTAQPARNLTVFDGYRSIASNSPPVTIPVSGFQTPPAGPVRTTVGFVAYEGDLGLGGDTATLNTTVLGGPANQPTNFFNSSISAAGANVTTRNPAYRNTMGYDADLFRADGILPNGATDATIRLTTSSDQYLPGVITFATDLYAPVVTLAKSVANLTHPSGPAERGDLLRYTVTATNSGQDGADDFRLTDAIPTGSTYAANSLRITTGAGSPAAPSDAAGDDRGEFEAANDRVVFRLGTGGNAVTGGRLAAGASTTITFDVRIAQLPPRTEIVNAAAAEFITQSLRVPLTADSNQVTTVVAAPDLTLDKSHTPEFVAGASSTYRLVVSNTGNLASDGSTVTVTDPLPVAAFASASNAGGNGWTCSLAGLQLTCSRTGVLAAGASFPPILVDVLVRNPAPAQVVNTATVAGGGDADLTNNTATDVGGTAQRADLRITKTVLPDTALSGQSVTYTLVAENLGPSTATAAQVGDPIGAGLTAASAVTTRGTCDASVSCSLGDLAPGESATITVTATVSANATTVANTATVSSPTIDPDPSNNGASAQVTVPNTADLRMTKSPSTSTPVAGAPGGLTYTLTATNDGPGAADAVQIVDDLSPAFTASSITPSAGFTCAAPVAGRLVCTGAALAPGASATITVVGTVTASSTAVQVNNVARVDSSTGDPDPSDNDDAVQVIGTPAADLSTTKEWGVDPAGTDPFAPITSTSAGATLLLRLTATNHGPSPATGVVLSDPLPAGVTYVSDDQGCGVTAGVVTCAVGPLAVDQQFVVLVTVTVSLATAGTTLTNTATVAGDQDDPVASNDQATAGLVVAAAADLVLRKFASATGPVAVGTDVTFTLEVTNDGPSPATGVVISDVLPTGLAFVSAGAGCTGAGGTLTCAVGPLAVGATTTRTFVARPTTAAAGSTLVNAASVTSPLDDPVPANNAATADVIVAPLADLRLEKTVADPTPEVDQDVTYTLTATNDGPNPATGVVLSDALPTGLAFVAASPGCAYSDASRTVACPLGTLAAGASAVRTITVRPLASASGLVLTNVATVAGNEADPDPGDNQAQVDVAVQPVVDLSLTKTANAPSVAAGGTLTYTLVVVNAGPSPSTETLVTDPLPAGTTLVSAQAGQGTCSAGPAGVSCALGTLPARGTAQVVIVVAVPAAAAGTTLTNLATVGSRETDARPQDNSASVETPVSAVPVTQAALTITKTVARTGGDDLTYTIVVTNTGTVAALDVAVTDTFSAPVTIVSATATAGTCAGTGPVVCSIPSVAPGAQVTITIVARPRAGGTLRNSATVTALNGDDAQGVLPVGVRSDPPPARLGASKAADRATVSAGAVIRYRVVVRNRSRVTAYDVRVCDRLPAGLTFVSAQGARIRGREACWTVARLGPGTSRTFTVRARADRLERGRRVTNTARADGSNTRPVSASAPVNVRGAGPGRQGGVTG